MPQESTLETMPSNDDSPEPNYQNINSYRDKEKTLTFINQNLGDLSGVSLVIGIFRLLGYRQLIFKQCYLHKLTDTNVAQLFDLIMTRLATGKNEPKLILVFPQDELDRFMATLNQRSLAAIASVKLAFQRCIIQSEHTNKPYESEVMTQHLNVKTETDIQNEKAIDEKTKMNTVIDKISNRISTLETQHKHFQFFFDWIDCGKKEKATAIKETLNNVKDKSTTVEELLNYKGSGKQSLKEIMNTNRYWWWQKEKTNSWQEIENLVDSFSKQAHSSK